MKSNEDEVKLKTSHVFETHENTVDETAKDTLRETKYFNEKEFVEINEPNIDGKIDDLFLIDEFNPIVPAKPKKRSFKFLFYLMILVLAAGAAEIGLFVYTFTQTFDWLAMVWLLIFILGVGYLGKVLLMEWFGLKNLKKQNLMQQQCADLYQVTAIGQANKLCEQMQQLLPESERNKHWQNEVQESFTDSEVLAIFEQKVLSPVDLKAQQIIMGHASAAGVMIAISPFALLDMIIVMWRNIHMMNQVSEVYGVKLGYWGRVKLIRNVFHTMIFAGAAEILSDVGTQAVSAGIAGKLSTRVSQGLGASLLTARLGLKALKLSRPMPFLSIQQPNLNDIGQQLVSHLSKQLK